MAVDGLTILRPCTGAPGEKPPIAQRPGTGRYCLVVIDGLDIIRPCRGAPNERPAPPAKAPRRRGNLCEFVEHDVEGDFVRLGECPKRP
jgi:hypothetical protein